MRHRVLPLLMLVVAVAVTGCDDDRHPTMLPTAPEQGSVAFVAVSDLDAPAGATVTVSAIVRQGSGIARVGAFTARLQYDTTGLEFVEELSLADGMRAVTARGGSVRAAGANAQGFDDGRLFAATFRVVRPAALRTLTLEIPELTGVDFTDGRPTLNVRPLVYAAPATADAVLRIH